jgi:hypothetical protein
MIDPRRYARVMGYSHGQATGHSRRAAHRQATGGQASQRPCSHGSGMHPIAMGDGQP